MCGKKLSKYSLFSHSMASNKYSRVRKLLAAGNVYVCRFLWRWCCGCSCLLHSQFVFIALRREKNDVHDLWISLETNRSNSLKGRRRSGWIRFSLVLCNISSTFYPTRCHACIYGKFSLIFQLFIDWFGLINHSIVVMVAVVVAVVILCCR